ncbi:MAG: prepilin peptidase [Candidatus Chaera renei]|uniref:Prepilin leader peptidase/N-methyltransferase n=1 Tax=Candidatus Chaera renei TaxID=2506947 RepID=A0A4Q0AJ13_9BACT|nr:MAG: prepilin peptidase [Candidatus Chaera renei]
MLVPTTVVLVVAGLIFGSFANAAIWRIKHGGDLIFGRSQCPRCRHRLAWYDLIPVISWLMLLGRCRYCRKPISWQYPAVELAVAAYFVASYLFWPYALIGPVAWAVFGLWLLFGPLLAILFVYDLRWYLLPDKIMLPLIVLAAISFVLRGGVLSSSFSLSAFAASLAAALAVVGGLYWALYLFSRGRWVGLGDVKLGVFIGLALGWQGALVALMLANLAGFLIVLPGLALRKLNMTSRVPFGPFLIAGFVAAGLFGEWLIDWYLNARWF